MRQIRSKADIAEGLDALRRVDPRLEPVIARAGEVELRLSAPGFASLCSIVMGQMVSRASAAAIFGRLTGLIDPLTPQAVLAADDAVFRAAGLSRSKHATVVAIAEAVADGRLDLDALCGAEPGEALAALTAVRGVGPWTAEVYLLFCAGNPDVFPSGDLALQVAAAEAFGLAGRPSARVLAAMAESWSPWRAVAARLLWALYRETRGRDALPAA